jgi:hypothetical protein
MELILNNMKNINKVHMWHFVTCIFLLLSLLVGLQENLSFNQDEMGFKNFIENIYTSFLLGGIIPLACCFLADLSKKTNKPIFIAGLLSQIFLLVSLVLSSELILWVGLCLPIPLLVYSLLNKSNPTSEESPFWFGFYMIFNTIAILMIGIKIVSLGYP